MKNLKKLDKTGIKLFKEYVETNTEVYTDVETNTNTNTDTERDIYSDQEGASELLGEPSTTTSNEIKDPNVSKEVIKGRTIYSIRNWTKY